MLIHELQPGQQEIYANENRMIQDFIILHTNRQSRDKCAYCKNIAEQQLGVGQALRLSSLLMGTQGEGWKDGVGLYLKPQDWKP